MKGMETQEQSITLKERARMLAYEDSRLGRPVIVDFIFGPGAADLDELAARVNLGDLVEFVRRCHEKLPRSLEVGLAGTEAPRERAASADTEAFSLPEGLLNKRFVLPSALDQVVREQLFSKTAFGALRPLLVGFSEGPPLQRLGLLGRAANEEQAGTADLPFYYATLLLVVRHLAERIQYQVVVEQKVKDSYDELREQIMKWTAKLSSSVKRATVCDRLLTNPFAPWALSRHQAAMPVPDIAPRYLAYRNPYGLTPELAEALDAHFEAKADTLAERDYAYDALRIHVARMAETMSRASMVLSRMEKVRKWANRAALAALFAASLGSLAAWLMPGGDTSAIGQSLASGELPYRATDALLAGGAVALLVFVVHRIVRRVRFSLSAEWRGFRSLLKSLHPDQALREALARALALARVRNALGRANLNAGNAAAPEAVRAAEDPKTGDRRLRKQARLVLTAKTPSRREWLDEVPSLLWKYLDMKVDELDARRLARVAFPAFDYSDLYAAPELKEKWFQNAVVCYGDDFSSLIIGAAQTGAVYFIDVSGSTELSTRSTLSNALEIYSRLVAAANETGGAPIWRKEAGDGRYYCYPVQEALRRAVLTLQGCSHPKVGLDIGIGLSVSEIFTDVTTGDFTNEAANRASRLNTRDEVVAAYVAARYVQKPFRVYIKYGRLYNEGLALDEKALHALKIEGWQAVRLVPPVEMRFPLITGALGDSEPGSVGYWGERFDPLGVIEKLTNMDAPPAFERYREQPDQVLAFEVFCRVTGDDTAYATPLAGNTLEGYLAGLGVSGMVYAASEIEKETTVKHLPVSLPSGQKVQLVVKYEKAVLRGLGATAIAEVEIPPGIIDDDIIHLKDFLDRIA